MVLNILNKRSFLTLVGVTLMVIGLSYSFYPETLLGFFIELPAFTRDLTHVFKGVTGLYFLMALYWILAAQKPHYQQGALISVVIFMLGLAVGRVLSLVTDGMPSVLLMIYLFMELGAAAVGIYLLVAQKDD